MSGENKMKNTKNNKKSDGKFKSKHIKHDAQDESARAKFGMNSVTSDGDRTVKDSRG